MIDSHCHLDCDAFAADRAAVLSRAAVAGVTDIVIPAVDEASWQPILALARESRGPSCFAALGIHPVAVPGMDAAQDDDVLRRLESLVGTGVTAIGECGLDATIDLERAPLDRQEQLLLRQLELARVSKLPVILHARGPGTYDRLLGILSAQPAGWSGVIHSYSGGAALVKKFAELPLCFGFAGPATYAHAPKIRASIAAVPDDRLLAETDAPDQTPEPHRPGRSEPAYLPRIIGGIAAARGQDVEEIRSLTVANARRLFGIKPS
jgi:TatD DNase family protein